jgi:glycosyltransferase involved in cell wall biosynthesis
MISVVIPTLNAGESLAAALSALVPAAVSNLVREVVVADAGSTDETLAVVDDAGAKLAGAGVAAGCALAKGPWLLLLTPQTRLAPEWEAAARDHIETHPTSAAYFRLALDDHRAGARLAEAAASIGAAFSARPSPAQGLLLPKRLYEEGGEDEIAAVIRRLRGRLRALAARALVTR